MLQRIINLHMLFNTLLFLLESGVLKLDTVFFFYSKGYSLSKFEMMLLRNSLVLKKKTPTIPVKVMICF